VNGIANEVRALRQAALLHDVQDLVLRNKDLEPILDLERIPFTQKPYYPSPPFRSNILFLGFPFPQNVMNHAIEKPPRFRESHGFNCWPSSCLAVNIRSSVSISQCHPQCRKRRRHRRRLYGVSHLSLHSEVIAPKNPAYPQTNCRTSGVRPVRSPRMADTLPTLPWQLPRHGGRS